MNKDFIPYEQALELKELGFNEKCIMYYGHSLSGYTLQSNDYWYSNNHWMFNANDNKDRHLMCAAPLYQQAFRFFREKYDFTYSIGKTNIAVIHVFNTTFLLENNVTYEIAELAIIKNFIEVAKNN